MQYIFSIFVLLCSVLKIDLIQSMSYDNRFLPLMPRTHPRIADKPSVVSIDLFGDFAHSAINDSDTVGIPEIFGKYDFKNFIDGMEAIGLPNPLIGTQFDPLVNLSIPYFMRGKIESQGIALAANPIIFNENFSVGATWFFMHLYSTIHFHLNTMVNPMSLDKEVALDKIRIQSQEQVGIRAPKWSTVGVSDLDVYFRMGKVTTYKYKMRRINAGMRGGLLIPSGQTSVPDNPASIPFGGNGHWGVYGTLDLECELKEDFRVGGIVRFSKRFTKTTLQRVPLAGENALFGVTKMRVENDPGFTTIISPYFVFEDLRDGLGFEGRYTIIMHNEDTINVPSLYTGLPVTTANPVPSLQLMNNVSGWTAEYLTFNLFYDFSKVKWKNFYGPILSLTWDMPQAFFSSHGVSKTNRVSLGLVVSW